MRRRDKEKQTEKERQTDRKADLFQRIWNKETSGSTLPVMRDPSAKVKPSFLLGLRIAATSGLGRRCGAPSCLSSHVCLPDEGKPWDELLWERRAGPMASPARPMESVPQERRH